MQEKCFLIRLTAANGGKGRKQKKAKCQILAFLNRFTAANGGKGFCKEKAKKAIF